MQLECDFVIVWDSLGSDKPNPYEIGIMFDESFIFNETIDLTPLSDRNINFHVTVSNLKGIDIAMNDAIFKLGPEYAARTSLDFLNSHF